MGKPARIATGPAAGNQDTPAPQNAGRQVLAPLDDFPIEVTRDEPTTTPPHTQNIPRTPAALERKTSRAADVTLPEAIQRALETDLPAPTAPPAEVLGACEKRLQAAETLREAMEERTLTAYFHYAGPAVRLAHATGSWRDKHDPTTGKPVRSWSAWLRLTKVSRQHAFRMVKELPITEALEGLNTGTLGVRQIDALSPVLNQHGKDKVREVWTTAAETGDTSAPALERVRDQLELKVSPEQDEDSEQKQSTAPVLKFQAKPGTFDENLVRTVAREQPEVARMVARTILAELGEDDT